MFEALRNELLTIKTPKFHVVDGAASEELRDAIAKSDPGLPYSYIDFVLKFGNVSLYRMRNYYQLEVYAAPRQALSPNNEELLNFGRTHSAQAYFKADAINDGQEVSVYEWDAETGAVEAADSFLKWFEDRANRARRTYSEKEWKLIIAGPRPFDSRELSIVEARKQFSWRKMGVSPSGNVIFEITNGSNMTLPFLSIGVRGALRPPRDGPLYGTVYIPISSLSPGSTGIFEQNCYRSLVDPEKAEPFCKPDPEPADRDLYKEFLRTQQAELR